MSAPKIHRAGERLGARPAGPTPLWQAGFDGPCAPAGNEFWTEVHNWQRKYPLKGIACNCKAKTWQSNDPEALRDAGSWN